MYESVASKILRNLVNLVAGAAISLSLSCSGASTTVIKSQDLEGVLQQYFTEKAQKALRDIPVYLIDPPQSGECAETLEGIGGFVMYPDFEWNTEILRDKCDVDVPKGRKIILVRDASEKALIHEYLHQADGLKLLSDLYAYAVFDRFF